MHQISSTARDSALVRRRTTTAFATGLTLLLAASSVAQGLDNRAPREPLLAYKREATPSETSIADSAVVVDPAVTPATNIQLTANEPLAGASRRLVPSTTEAAPATRPVSQLPFALPATQMLSTAGAGLAIVVGLLLACVWLVRKGGSRSTSALPAEAFAVLGRAPLFGQTAAHLLRLGNKLVLVAATPDGVQPIVEVTDRDEVDRLIGLCMGSESHSATAEFQQVLKQLAQEPAKGFLGRQVK